MINALKAIMGQVKAAPSMVKAKSRRSEKFE
jgi:hypothetical protein